MSQMSRWQSWGLPILVLITVIGCVAACAVVKASQL